MTYRGISWRKKISGSLRTKGLLHSVKDPCLNSGSAINLLSKYLLKANYLPGTIVITGYMTVNKKVTVFVL